MAVPSPTKSQMRSDALARRRDHARALSPQLRADLETELARILLPRLAGARVIALYQPMQDEISPLPLLNGLADAQDIVFPWFADRDANMIFRTGPAAEPGPWGILQPSSDAPALPPDMILVPFVLADRRGTRIGRGKGHYDRALAHLQSAGTVTKVGIGWEDQVSDVMIDEDPWDVRLDAVATPRGWIDCR